MNCFYLINKLMGFDPDLVKQMESCSHHFSDEFKSPYHLEGDVLTHTKMVLDIADKKNFSDLVKIACLLHDIGKPLSKVLDDKKCRAFMMGHEGISSFLSLKYLDLFDISDENKIDIFFAIANHIKIHDILKNGKNVYESLPNQVNTNKILCNLGVCDELGRISSNHNPLNLELLRYKENSKRKYNNEPIVNCLIGLPFSGKSEYAKSTSYSIVSEKESADSLLKKYFNEKNNVCIDMTNLSKKKRQSKISIFEGYWRIATLFLKDFDTILNKNKLDNQYNFYDFINMMKKFSAPNYTEFDEIQVVFKGRIFKI